jgi:hypothetical protein
MSVIQGSSEIHYLCGGRCESFTPPVNEYAAEPAATYWTWRRLTMFVMTLKNGRSLTPGEWQALHREIPSLSLSKKTWLYRQLKSYLTSEALKYLFSSWRPPSPSVGLDQWL